MDAGFSDSFMENIDRLILRMYHNHPLKTKKTKNKGDENHSKFYGLALNKDLINIEIGLRS